MQFIETRLPGEEQRDRIIPPSPPGRWTYHEYAALPEDSHRYEIINGVLYMAPAPGIDHQTASGLLSTYLTIAIQFSGRGRVFAAPCDVLLAPDCVVQPDVLVVLKERAHIITPKHINGAPNLVVEIASGSTASYDRSEKLTLYARAGVSEYWIADPKERTVEVLVLDTPDGEPAGYRSLGMFRGSDHLPSLVVPEFPASVEQFFS